MTSRARALLGVTERPPRAGGAPAPPRRTPEREREVIGHPRTRPKPRRKTRPKPPRAADRHLYAHEGPPLEPLPERPDRPSPGDLDWSPEEFAPTPTQELPAMAGFSLGGALLSIPIAALRRMANLGLHAANAILCRVRRARRV